MRRREFIGPAKEGEKNVIARPLFLLAVTSAIVTLGGPPTLGAEFATKEEAIAMVKDAVAFIKEQGPDKAYTEISNKGGHFHDRDLYITVLDLDGKVLAHGQNENLVGKVLIDTKDADGKQFVKERMEVIRHQSSFWQHYKFMNPVTKKVEPKQMYCERFNETAVCGGVYSE
jgi:cytochrome c